ncbi:hypothetical protein LINPERPRIM_LOCUS41131 [Linum perenne]
MAIPESDDSAHGDPIDDISTGVQDAVLGILDVTNPYYIHLSEHWGQCLVSEVLTESNYSEWSMSMLMVLDGKNKTGLIDGSFLAPDSGHPFFRFGFVIISLFLVGFSDLFRQPSRRVFSTPRRQG